MHPTVKISAQRPTHISAVATVLPITKTVTLKYYYRRLETNTASIIIIHIKEKERMNENVFIYMANNNFHTIPCVFRERESVCVCACVRVLFQATPPSGTAVTCLSSENRHATRSILEWRHPVSNDLKIRLCNISKTARHYAQFTRHAALL